MFDWMKGELFWHFTFAKIDPTNKGFYASKIINSNNKNRPRQLSPCFKPQSNVVTLSFIVAMWLQTTRLLGILTYDMVPGKSLES